LQEAKNNPALQAMMMLPENMKLFRDFVGIEGFEVPGASADIQQRREIEELLALPEISDQEIAGEVQKMAQVAVQAMQANPGAPPPPPPTPQMIRMKIVQQQVPVDMDWDMHQQHMQAVQDWLASEDRYAEEAKGNQSGIENVKAHGMIHKQAMQANQPPPQQKPPSESITYKDLPPSGQAQLAAQAGIKLNPDELMAQHQEKTALQAQRGMNA
jgi:hypothetical protein